MAHPIGLPGGVPSVQRSFRLSMATARLLDEMADATGESRNALVERLLGDAVRTARHPLVRFRGGAAGRREPAIVGTRLLVRQVIATARANAGDIADTADLLAVPARVVRAAIAYYAEFADEIDADTAAALRAEAEERARWEREQTAIA